MAISNNIFFTPIVRSWGSFDKGMKKRERVRLTLMANAVAIRQERKTKRIYRWSGDLTLVYIKCEVTAVQQRYDTSRQLK